MIPDFHFRFGDYHGSDFIVSLPRGFLVVSKWLYFPVLSFRLYVIERPWSSENGNHVLLKSFQCKSLSLIQKVVDALNICDRASEFVIQSFNFVNGAFAKESIFNSQQASF